MNTEEYIETVKTNLQDLQNLVRRYHPYYAEQHSHKITANKAENVCQEVRKEIQQNWSQEADSPLMALDLFIEENNCPRLVTLFNDVWFGMPESFEVRSEPGFNVLCDLCSEWEG